MLEHLSWEEIQDRYRGEWVEMLHCDWPEGLPHPRSGIIRVHSSDRKHFFVLLKRSPAPNSTILFVGQPTRLRDLCATSLNA